MVIRVVLAAVVAVALLAAALPGIETARVDRTSAAMDRTIDRIERAGRALLANEAADAGARRVVTVSLPAQSLAAAGVDHFAVRCSPLCAVSYRLVGGERQRHQLQAVPLATPDGPVTFSEAGTHRLVLGIHQQEGTQVVTVRG